MDCTYAAGIGIANMYDALFLDDSMDPLDAINRNSENKTKKIKHKKLQKPKELITTESKAKPKEQNQTKAADLPQENRRIKPNNKASIDKPLFKPTKPVGKATIDAEAEKAGIKQVPYSQQLTLDEYRKVSAARSQSRKMPNYNLRQPNEGEDVSQWKNLVLLVKKHDEEKVNEYETPELPQRVRRQKRVPVSVTFGDRPGRYRRECSGAPGIPTVSTECTHQRPPLVDNEKEFPSLGQ